VTTYQQKRNITSEDLFCCYEYQLPPPARQMQFIAVSKFRLQSIDLFI